MDALPSRRSFAVAALAVVSLAAAGTDNAFAGRGGKRPPNVVLIMADDFGFECVAANGGNYKTPNLDRLAARGVRFTNCYVQPLCTPTRVQLMTGLYNVRNYVRFGHLDPAQTTFAHLLRRAGYVTGIVGKWQLGQGVGLPKHFGFDEACLWQHTRRPPRYANPGLEINGVAKDYTNGEYGPNLVNDFALDFVTRHKDRPFLLYYPMILTHGPFQPTPDSANWDPTAKGEKKNNNTKNFPDMVAYADKVVGRLVARLDELGLTEQTLLLFLGDNGTGRGITSLLNGRAYPGGKGSTTVYGMHVPLIACWPGTVPGGRVCDDLIDSTDFAPTLCAAAGVPLGKDATDGHGFLPQLRGEKGTPRPWYYCWYSRDGGTRGVQEFAATTRYKLYRSGDFFDYRADPAEKKAVPVDALRGETAEAARLLRGVLERYADARPAHLRGQ